MRAWRIALRSLAVAATVAPLCGCVSLRVSSTPAYPSMKISGLLNGYAQVSELPSLDTLLELNVLDGREPGEFVSVDMWALGVGVGAAGARLNVPFFETAFGTLFYDPKPLYKPRGGERHEEDEGDRGDERRPADR